jgi:type II secretory ATPase GspE/PulE/Tfp pilus assembly ATPase PilB-like protein
MEEGMLSMKQDGYVKVLEGVTSMDEVIRVAQY